MRHTLRVPRHESLISPDPGVVVNISGLGQPNDRVNKHIRPPLPGCSDSQLSVRSVHRVPGLESDDLPPCDLVEVCSKLSGCVSEGDIVVVGWSLDGLDGTTDVEIVCRFAEIGDSRVSRVISTHDSGSLGSLVGTVNVGNGEDGKGGLVSGVSKGKTSSWSDREGVNGCLGDVEGDRHGEESALTLTVDFSKTESVSDAACQLWPKLKTYEV